MNVIEKLSLDLKRVFRHVGYSGGAIACFVLLVISLLLVELPPWLLDIFLVANILLALTVLMRAVFSDTAMRISSFPTIIVLATLFRLALNVSSTKLILLDGHLGLDAAGRVIESFGSFVVRGDFWVGAIVFGIIAIVNFVVIAKGSARVAEVAARFTLDALPGKQLAIDADLRGGNLTSDEAAVRRVELSQESQFYGAMDGAMKWVQGDAVAGIAIAFINAIGGISLGLFRGMGFEDAVRSFGVLTIGDGLISILPSLLISVAAGIIVTQVSGRDGEGAGQKVISQLVGDSKAAIVASLALLSVGMLSLIGLLDFPFLPFFIVSGLGLVILVKADGISQRSSGEGDLDLARTTASGGRAKLPSGRIYPAATPGTAADHGVLDQLLLEVDNRVLGPYLGLSVNGTQDGNEDRNAEFYRLADLAWGQNFKNRGLLLPPINLAVSKDLAPGSYRISVRERSVRQGNLRIDQVLVSSHPSFLKVLGFNVGAEAKHPVSNRVGTWIDGRKSNFAPLRHLGLEIYNPANFLIYQCVGAVYEVIDEIFGLAEVKILLDSIRPHYSELLLEIFDNGILTLPEFTELLRKLVRERVGIRDLKLILEGVVEYRASNADIEDRQEWLEGLHSFLRVVLARSIIDDVVGPGDRFRTFALSGEIEEEFRSAVSVWEGRRSRPPLNPEFEVMFRERALKFFNPVLERGAVPIVVLCSPDIRLAVNEFFGRELNSGEWLRTLCYQELQGTYRPESIGVLRILQ